MFGGQGGRAKASRGLFRSKHSSGSRTLTVGPLAPSWLWQWEGPRRRPQSQDQAWLSVKSHILPSSTQQRAGVFAKTLELHWGRGSVLWTPALP